MIPDQNHKNNLKYHSSNNYNLWLEYHLEAMLTSTEYSNDFHDVTEILKEQGIENVNTILRLMYIVSTSKTESLPIISIIATLNNYGLSYAECWQVVLAFEVANLIELVETTGSIIVYPLIACPQHVIDHVHNTSSAFPIQVAMPGKHLKVDGLYYSGTTRHNEMQVSAPAVNALDEANQIPYLIDPFVLNLAFEAPTEDKEGNALSEQQRQDIEKEYLIFKDIIKQCSTDTFYILNTMDSRGRMYSLSRGNPAIRNCLMATSSYGNVTKNEQLKFFKEIL